MIRLIIFDWDDVFTQGSIKAYYTCYHKALDAVGVHLPPDEEERRIKKYWGSDHKKQIEYLLKEHPELIDTAVHVYQEHALGDTFVDCLSIVPGSQALLKRLSKTYTLAIATGAQPTVLKEKLFPKFHIPNVFSNIITIYDLDDLAHVKPHPFMVNQILESQHIAASETILVGDAESDMQMAWNAHVEPIAVLTGHLTRPQAEKIGVRHIIERVTLLEPKLLQLS